MMVGENHFFLFFTDAGLCCIFLYSLRPTFLVLILILVIFQERCDLSLMQYKLGQFLLVLNFPSL